jgi:hypothetical protein
MSIFKLIAGVIFNVAIFGVLLFCQQVLWIGIRNPGTPYLRNPGGVRGHHTYFYFLFVGKSRGEVELKDRYGVP